MPHDAPQDPRDDLVASAIARVRAVAPDVTPDQWQRVEVEFRAARGGRRCYTAKRLPEQKTAATTRGACG